MADLTLHMFISSTCRLHITFGSDGYAQQYFNYLNIYCKDLEPKPAKGGVSVALPSEVTGVTFRDRRLGLNFASTWEADYWRDRLKFWKPKSRDPRPTLWFERHWRRERLNEELARIPTQRARRPPRVREVHYEPPREPVYQSKSAHNAISQKLLAKLDGLLTTQKHPRIDPSMEERRGERREERRAERKGERKGEGRGLREVRGEARREERREEKRKERREERREERGGERRGERGGERGGERRGERRGEQRGERMEERRGERRKERRGERRERRR